MPPDVYIVGMSHTEAPRSGLDRYSGELSFVIDNLNAKDRLSYTSPERRLNEEHFTDNVKAGVVASMMYGNWYNSFALIENPVPFDFVSPDYDFGTLEGRYVVPYGQMYRKFNNGIRNLLETLVQLRGLVPGRLVHLEPPPPIGSEEFIRANPGPFEAALAGGVTPGKIRLKLWKLQSRITADVCSENGIEFIEFPAEAQDPEGFLAEPYRFKDPVHANARYGILALRQLEAMHKGLA